MAPSNCGLRPPTTQDQSWYPLRVVDMVKLMENTNNAESPACNFTETRLNHDSVTDEILSNVLQQNCLCADDIEKVSENTQFDNGHSNQDEVFEKIDEEFSNEKKCPAKKNVTFQISPVIQDNTIQMDVNSDFKRMNSEYVARASSMREKIEKKITEIEQKIDLPASDLNQECIETESSPSDYNLIKVLDTKRSRSCSVSEMRQNTIDRLQFKLEKAEKDLELREEEVFRLRKIRDEVGSEIEDLTASLFEEANNMVRNAHAKQQRAEKTAKEANMKLGMLQEEVQALKEMVQSTKMYSTVVDHPEFQEKKSANLQRETYEVDPIFNDEFVKWRQNPNLNKDTPFMQRIYEEDIKATLCFKNTELSNQVLSAIEEDKITIEKISINKNEPLPKKCALMDAPRLCTYKMCLDGQNCFNISTLSRNRITAICDLFCYLRYIQKGLITLRIHEVYLEILKKRRRITSAKLGLVDDIME